MTADFGTDNRCKYCRSVWYNGKTIREPGHLASGLPLTSRVILNKSFKLFEPQFSFICKIKG